MMYVKPVSRSRLVSASSTRKGASDAATANRIHFIDAKNNLPAGLLRKRVERDVQFSGRDTEPQRARVGGVNRGARCRNQQNAYSA